MKYSLFGYVSFWVTFHKRHLVIIFFGWPVKSLIFQWTVMTQVSDLAIFLYSMMQTKVPTVLTFEVVVASISRLLSCL